ncbi:natural killer cell receptor 2B4 [Ursus americanus]|uniref:natural killer cell receptor 2B4 n=1 Tax=Ursus americanus TaxID=9643 RepID=UPI001E67A5FD|nr:natural killer cell receptor 2B4 [Ursus americanus]
MREQSVWWPRSRRPLCRLGMLGQALVLTLLLLLRGHQGQDPAERVVGLSGHQLLLRPPRPETAHINSVKWKMKHDSTSEASVILTWKNGSGLNYVQRALNDFNNTLNFIIEDLALLIKASQHNYSGLYTLEVTDDTGKVKHHHFQVSVFDHVGTLEVAEERKVLDGGKCQVSLSCSVSRGGNVSYVWYRGNELIQTPDNLGKLEQEIEVGNLSVVTCNVSNPASWVNHTFTHSCQSVDKYYSSVNFLMIIVILLVILLLVALTGFCVWRRKRKQSEMSPAEPLTVYEDVKNTQNRRNQEQRQNPSGEGSTIYSMIQSQSSAPTSREANTLYALVQPSRKSESKKKNQSSSVNYTVYEEVGRRPLKAQNPARLSRRELENFRVYS